LRRYLIILIIGSIALSNLLISGCRQPPPPEKGSQVQVDQPGDFFPLTRGSTWDYAGEGNEFASFTREVVLTRGNLAQVRENNGGTISVSVFEVTGEAITRRFFQGETYEEEDFLDRQPTEETIIIKGPLQIGTTWGPSGAIKTITDLQTTIETPAGTFPDCLEIETTYPDSKVYEYYQKGVGMIERKFISGEFQVKSSLREFSIK